MLKNNFSKLTVKIPDIDFDYLSYIDYNIDTFRINNEKKEKLIENLEKRIIELEKKMWLINFTIVIIGFFLIIKYFIINMFKKEY